MAYNFTLNHLFIINARSKEVSLFCDLFGDRCEATEDRFLSVSESFDWVYFADRLFDKKTCDEFHEQMAPISEHFRNEIRAAKGKKDYQITYITLYKMLKDKEAAIFCKLFNRGKEYTIRIYYDATDDNGKKIRPKSAFWSYGIDVPTAYEYAEKALAGSHLTGVKLGECLPGHHVY